MAGFQETLRRLAIFDEGFVTAGSGHDLARTAALDPRTAALLQSGGAGGHRVAGGLPGMERRRALAAGASKDEIAGVLLAIAPVAGMGRVVSAAPGHPGHQCPRQAAADRAMATEPTRNHSSSNRRGKA